jgi:SAM-dependent methyltransferase
MPMYQTHYSGIGYYPLWQEVMKRITKKDVIVELACGVGQLAHMLYDRGYDYSAGYDFSQVAIEKAKERISLNFNQVDLLKTDVQELVRYADVVIMCEFLEHIEDDIDLLSKIDKRMIITLPTFDGTSHVRHFPTLEDVLRRYDRHMRIEELTQYGNHYLLIGVANGNK